MYTIQPCKYLALMVIKPATLYSVIITEYTVEPYRNTDNNVAITQDENNAEARNSHVHFNKILSLHEKIFYKMLSLNTTN